MFKNKSARITAFIGTLGASAALIGMAATNTGAYFTDSENGTLSGKTGHLQVEARSNYTLNFADMVPGEYQSRDVHYHTDSSTAEDIWLKFPDGVEYAKFTGEKHGPLYDDGGMGRFGHFQVKDNGGNLLFSSWNLQNASANTSGCADTNGHGSNNPPADRDATPAYCGVPHFMLIESNVATNSDKKLTMVFGVTGRMEDQNSSQPPSAVPFQVVATQHGVRPDAENF
jgi:hypothetical protein